MQQQFNLNTFRLHGGFNGVEIIQSVGGIRINDANVRYGILALSYLNGSYTVYFDDNAADFPVVYETTNRQKALYFLWRNRNVTVFEDLKNFKLPAQIRDISENTPDGEIELGRIATWPENDETFYLENLASDE